MGKSTVILVLTSLLLSACYSNPNYSPVKPHHTNDGFTNRYVHAPKNSFWKWQWQRLTKGVAPDPETGYGFPVVRPDAAFLGANRSVETMTWLGHDSFLIQIGGLNIMTDPHLTERASPLSFMGPKRHVPVPMSFDDLPQIDVVLISHSHYDHLDRATLQRLSRQDGGPPRFLMGLNLLAWAKENGIANASEHDWDDVVTNPWRTRAPIPGCVFISFRFSTGARVRHGTATGRCGAAGSSNTRAAAFSSEVISDIRRICETSVHDTAVSTSR